MSRERQRSIIGSEVANIRELRDNHLIKCIVCSLACQILQKRDYSSLSVFNLVKEIFLLVSYFLCSFGKPVSSPLQLQNQWATKWSLAMKWRVYLFASQFYTKEKTLNHIIMLCSIVTHSQTIGTVASPVAYI